MNSADNHLLNIALHMQLDDAMSSDSFSPELIPTLVQKMRADMSILAEHMREAAEDLSTSGTPVGNELVEEIAKIRSRFDKLVDDCEEYMQSRDGGPVVSRPLSINHIEERWETHQESVISKQIATAIAINLEASCIRWTNASDVAFAGDLQKLTESNFAVLKSTYSDESRTLALALIGGTDPAAALLRLVKHKDSLSDDELEQCSDIVSDKFGQRIERASLAGRLLVEEFSENIKTEATNTNAPNNQLIPDDVPNSVVEKIEVASPVLNGLQNKPEDLEEVVGQCETQTFGVSGEHSEVVINKENEKLPESVKGTQAQNWKNDQRHALGNELKLEPLRQDKSEQHDTEVVGPAKESTSSTERSNDAPETKTHEEGSLTGNPGTDVTAHQLLIQHQTSYLPASCSTFSIFSERYHCVPNGSVREYPWIESPQRHLAQLNAFVGDALEARNFAHMHILCRAIVAAGGVPPVEVADLESLENLLAGRELAPFDIEHRANRLRVHSQTLTSEPNAPLSLFLTALSGKAEQPVSDAEIDKLISGCFGTDDPIGKLLEKLLKQQSRMAFSIQDLRSRINDAPEVSIADFDKKTAELCSSLHDLIRQVWRAGGGTISKTHSRKAWDEFIASADTVLSPLTSIEKALDIGNLQDTERQVRKLNDSARKLFDKREVKAQDRKNADRIVAQLCDASSEIIGRLSQRRSRVEREESHDVGLMPIQELKSFVTRENHASGWNRLIAEILIHLFANPKSEETDPATFWKKPFTWAILDSDIFTCPDLLLELEENDINEPIAIDPRKIVRAQHAAMAISNQIGESITSGMTALRNRLLSSKRFDLLRKIQFFLNDAEKSELTRHSTAQVRKINETLTRVRKSHRELQQLASPMASSVFSVIEEAEKLRERILDDSLDLDLFLAWLDEVNKAANENVGLIRANLTQRSEVVADNDERSRILERLHSGRFSDALFLLGEEIEPTTVWQRETLLREEAMQQLANPMLELATASALPESTSQFIEGWRRGFEGHVGADQPLRTKFARLMFSSTEKDLGKPAGRNEKARYCVSCQNIIDWLTSQKLNPTFLPQLRQYQQLVILTPLEKSDSPAFIERLRHQAANECQNGSQNLAVFLVPQLGKSVRENAIREFAQHGLRASILDDLDICRLLNIGGQRINMVLGLLELVLEQQPLDTFMPYQRHDGQHVRQEMFVGRREQAREIAETTQYSRLFSGRKLGKSALLSFVRQSYDRTKLPSGNTLRVLYVNGVGASQESDFVHRLRDALRKQIDFVDGDQYDAQPPSEQLVRIFDQFNEERPNESLLVLFDEADLFMERQIAEYDTQKERSLSFTIRSRVEADKDSSGLPRVRFLFSGYRVTYRSDGAWTGAWGDVLRLTPLDPDDAATLVRGPLERMGIPVGDLAPTIAWRCGYQPALIIGFCRQLLQRKSLRQSIDDDAVAATFENTNVQDEIRSIIDSNFQGNRLSGIIFLAVVAEFSRQGASSGIVQLADVIFERLVEVRSEMDWLQTSGMKSSVSKIDSVIQDLVRRQLLREQKLSGSPKTYFMKFPHHVHILARDLMRDPEGVIRREIEDYVQGIADDTQSDPSGVASSLYGFDDVAGAAKALASNDPDFPTHAIVFGNDWYDAVPLDEICPEGGLKVVELGKGDAATAISKSPLIVVKGGDGNVFKETGGRDPLLPPPILIGNAGLLREAMRLEMDSDTLLYRVGLGRIARPSVQWWFTRKRAIEFEADGLDQIMSRTSGIPALLEQFDQLFELHESFGSNVSQSSLATILQDFEESLVSVSKAWFGESPNCFLNQREQEVIEMILRLSKELTPGEPLESWLLGWSQMFSGEEPIKELSPADLNSMRLVQELGLLPVISTAVRPIERFVSVSPDDAIYRFMRAGVIKS